MKFLYANSLGSCLTKLPLEPKIGKMLIYSVHFGCVEYALTAAALLSLGKDLFLTNERDRNRVRGSRNRYSKDVQSDVLVAVRLLKEYDAARLVGKEVQFCDSEALSVSSMRMLVGIREQLRESIRHMGFPEVHYPCGPVQLLGSSGTGRTVLAVGVLEAMLVAGLYPSIAQFTPNSQKKVLRTMAGRPATPSQHSCIVKPGDNLSGQFVVYFEQTKFNILQLRNCSIIGVSKLF